MGKRLKKETLEQEDLNIINGFWIENARNCNNNSLSHFLRIFNMWNDWNDFVFSSSLETWDCAKMVEREEMIVSVCTNKGENIIQNVISVNYSYDENAIAYITTNEIEGEYVKLDGQSHIQVKVYADNGVFIKDVEVQ